MAVDATRALTVAVMVNSDATTSLNNNAVITSTTADPAPNNNAAQAPTQVTTLADLAITKTHSPEPIVAGQMVTYSLVFTNYGPSYARNVYVGDNFPYYSMTLVSVDPPATGSPNPIYWAVGDLAPGTSATYTIRAIVNADAVGVITNTAGINSYGTTDPVPENNLTTDPAQVTVSVDLVSPRAMRRILCSPARRSPTGW